ncbi:MAG: hypothetical protein OFPI_39820 [Osedax symbiont Rs2]|nr:MAG: hypothetical protein OFPI_39820 [Osedax symbiont Rs2]
MFNSLQRLFKPRHDSTISQGISPDISHRQANRILKPNELLNKTQISPSYLSHIFKRATAGV